MEIKIIEDYEYREWLKELKKRIRQFQLKASVAVNAALMEFYWRLGTDIVDKQKHTTWGSGFLKQLSADLMAEFPNMKGFSHSSLQYIRRWYLFYSNCGTACSTITQQPASQLSESDNAQKMEQPVPHLNWPQVLEKLFQIPWGHNLVIISKCKDVTEALFYIRKTQFLYQSY